MSPLGPFRLFCITLMIIWAHMPSALFSLCIGTSLILFLHWGLLALFHWFLGFFVLLDFHLFLFRLIYFVSSSSSALCEFCLSLLQEPEVRKGPVSEAPGNSPVSRSLGFSFVVIINPPEKCFPQGSVWLRVLIQM